MPGLGRFASRKKTASTTTTSNLQPRPSSDGNTNEADNTVTTTNVISTDDEKKETSTVTNDMFASFGEDRPMTPNCASIFENFGDIDADTDVGMNVGMDMNFDCTNTVFDADMSEAHMNMQFEPTSDSTHGGDQNVHQDQDQKQEETQVSNSESNTEANVNSVIPEKHQPPTDEANLILQTLQNNEKGSGAIPRTDNTQGIESRGFVGSVISRFRKKIVTSTVNNTPSISTANVAIPVDDQEKVSQIQQFPIFDADETQNRDTAKTSTDDVSIKNPSVVSNIAENLEKSTDVTKTNNTYDEFNISGDIEKSSDVIHGGDLNETSVWNSQDEQDKPSVNDADPNVSQSNVYETNTNDENMTDKAVMICNSVTTAITDFDHASTSLSISQPAAETPTEVIQDHSPRDAAHSMTIANPSKTTLRSPGNNPIVSKPGNKVDMLRVMDRPRRIENLPSTTHPSVNARVRSTAHEGENAISASTAQTTANPPVNANNSGRTDSRSYSITQRSNTTNHVQNSHTRSLKDSAFRKYPDNKKIIAGQQMKGNDELSTPRHPDNKKIIAGQQTKGNDELSTPRQGIDCGTFDHTRPSVQPAMNRDPNNPKPLVVSKVNASVNHLPTLGNTQKGIMNRVQQNYLAPKINMNNRQQTAASQSRSRTKLGPSTANASHDQSGLAIKQRRDTATLRRGLSVHPYSNQVRNQTTPSTLQHSKPKLKEAAPMVTLNQGNPSTRQNIRAVNTTSTLKTPQLKRRQTQDSISPLTEQQTMISIAVTPSPTTGARNHTITDVTTTSQNIQMQDVQKFSTVIPPKEQIRNCDTGSTSQPTPMSAIPSPKATNYNTEKLTALDSNVSQLSTVPGANTNRDKTNAAADNNFDDLLSQFSADLVESSDTWDRCDTELVELRLKLCISENTALRLHGDYDDLLEDVECMLAEI